MADPITLGVSLVSGLFSGISASGKARRARRERARYEAQIKQLEASRQEIINPYENVKDLSGMITNPFANLQVATKAAEMQIEQADISLASTLDTLRATGAGSSGATALAQAALRSKQGVAATIEQQEMKNAELRARGEQETQRVRMSEAQRLQQADVQGRQFMFQTREQREIMQLDRLSAMAGGAAQRAAAYGSQASAGFGSALGSAAGLGYGLANDSFD